MLKPLSYPDILLGLPVDETLTTFLARAGLPLPEGFAWSDDTDCTKRLIAAVQACPDQGVRDRIAAGLHTSAQLAGQSGKQALFQAARADSAVLLALIQCRSDMHRAFWMFVHHPLLFEQAGDIEYADQYIPQAQQHDLGVQLPVRRDAESLANFCAAIRAFYQQEMGCGEVCIAHLLDRASGTQLLSVHAKDLATQRVEFDGTELQRRVGSPTIHMVLEYSAATGVVRTVIKGGAKYQQMLVDAFAIHLLGVDQVHAERIKQPTLDLTGLRLGFQVPQALDDGFLTLQVKSLTMLAPDRSFKVELTAMASADHACVTELAADHFPSDNPLHGGWEIQAARINLYYPPEVGRSRGKVIAVEVTRRGRLNLHKYDEKLRAQLEGYLISLGIMQPQQRLSPQVVPTAELAGVAAE